MKFKTLLWSGVSILAAGVLAGAVWWEFRPQVITFDNGDRLKLLAVDYGTHHAPPAVRTWGTAPRPRRGSAFNTTNNTLVVWVQQEFDSKEWRNFQYYAYDRAGTACAGSSGMNYGNGRQGSQIVGIQFSAFPRRQGKFYVRVSENSNQGQEMSDQKFVIANPARGPVLNWTPESLPATKEDDDLSVTLTKLLCGAGMPYQRNNDDENDPANKGVQATFHVERNGTNASNWQPVAIETSDATGNRLSGWPNTQVQGDDLVTTYQYALWPEEPAWKVRCEFSKQSGFPDNELWTIPNLPLQPGRQQDFWNYNRNRNSNKVAYAETTLNGIALKIFPAKQFTDVSPNSQPQGGLTIQATPSLPEGMRMTLVKLTDDQTNDIGNWNYGSYGSGGNSTTYRYGLRDLGGATNLNVTFAVHRSRFVEFTAKPQKDTTPVTTPDQQ